MRSVASRMRKRLLAAASRRPAAIPAAPAPTMIASSIPAGCFRVAASAGAATADAEAARKARRLIGFMVGAVLRDPSSEKQLFRLRRCDGAPACAPRLSSLGLRAVKEPHDA